jgi:hypothetical protein
MPFVKAGPNQYLLVGRRGVMENRGSAVQVYLRPGSVHVVVPGAKQEAPFAFTQETRDGIPLRFKGIIIYRVTDPVAAARQFDFGSEAGLGQVTSQLSHLVLGELRDAVSHMTMVECIEQRKTTLSQVAETALRSAIHGADGGMNDWGVTVEAAQLAQVFIVDPDLRRQLEAEVRNEIKLRSDQADLRTAEETQLAAMVSDGRVQEQKLAGDRESLRREEALELARLARERRVQAEQVAAEQQRLRLEQERFSAQMVAEQARVTSEAPVRLFRIAREREILADELELRSLQGRVQALDVERELLLPRAQQELRRDILPLEQAPQIVESASHVLQGANLSIYGDDGQVLGQLGPLLEMLAGAVRQAAGRSFPDSAPTDAT